MTTYYGKRGDLNLQALWKESVRGKEWEKMNVSKELAHIQSKIEIDDRVPTNNCIFRLWSILDVSAIKVVLVGQDPYPELIDVDEIKVPRACGFAFSSPLGKLPQSLKVIFREMKVENPTKKSGDLSYLLGEGVFLMNAYLTIKIVDGKGVPGTHTSWSCFTKKVIEFIKQKNPGVVWLAVGEDAKYMMETCSIIDYISAAHPAARFAKSNGFVGSKVFILVNEKLKSKEEEPIPWMPMDDKDVVDTQYYL